MLVAFRGKDGAAWGEREELDEDYRWKFFQLVQFMRDNPDCHDLSVSYDNGDNVVIKRKEDGKPVSAEK